jgi:hypothetical protein
MICYYSSVFLAHIGRDRCSFPPEPIYGKVVLSGYVCSCSSQIFHPTTASLALSITTNVMVMTDSPSTFESKSKISYRYTQAIPRKQLRPYKGAARHPYAYEK